MKTKILLSIALLIITISISAQVKLRGSDSKFMVGYETYTPLTLGYYTSQGYNNGTWAIEWWDNGLNIWKPWPSVNSGNYKFFIDDATGNVGIGRKPTAGKLDVAGDIAINGVIKVSSDARLKSNILGLTDCMERLNKLNGKSYNKKRVPQADYNLESIEDSVKYKTILYENEHKNNEAEKTEYGYIGQELLDVFPELVQKDTLGYYYVNYIGLIPVITEALKDLQKINDEQNAQIQELQKLLKKDSISRGKSSLKSAKLVSENAIENSNQKNILYSNSPNPFNSNTEIKYFIKEAGSNCMICIYDLNGTQLKCYHLNQSAGEGVLNISANELNPGLFIYSLIIDNQVIDSKKMVITN